MAPKPIFEIDGANFDTLEEFYEEAGCALKIAAPWGRNLDAFNDILRGGFGTPEEGFVIRWRNSEISRQRLGYPETVRQLEKRLERCHPSNRESVQEELADARQNTGTVAFDWLVEIIRTHGVGGEESEDGVELVLE